LIQKAGVSYRAAYQAVGAAMNELEAQGKNILSMKVGNLSEHLRQRSGVELSFGQPELDYVLDVTNCANMKVSPGSSGQNEIEKMIHDCLGVIDQHKSSALAKREKISLGSEEMYERVNAIIS
jgi:argininosuccinate lyase